LYLLLLIPKFVVLVFSSSSSSLFASHSISHGERWDYTDIEWAKQSEYPHDSPLSKVGERQAAYVLRSLFCLVFISFYIYYIRFALIWFIYINLPFLIISDTAERLAYTKPHRIISSPFQRSVMHAEVSDCIDFRLGSLGSSCLGSF
jgi:hypothetical protein